MLAEVNAEHISNRFGRAAGRKPRTAVECEKAILGAILVDENAMGRVRETLRVVHFADMHHAIIYATMLIMDDSGTPIDQVTLSEELLAVGALPSVNIPHFVAVLAGETHTSANIVYHAKFVIRAYASRLNSKMEVWSGDGE